ncbi:MAG: penicillin-binding protein 2 [Armatimonadota bacterium]|nr:penicillin-binding protein 2 [Armatimonadota bacterium]MCX7777773.1 penicillin-binding protein 2 [Armatimonadota bacterium]MDW8025340.1 penicillin-binding protein 2 [Armatimonadota bacterium]
MNGRFSDALQRRINAIQILLAVIFLVFAARLWYLQILQASYYDERARRHWVRSVVIHPPRGLIVDSNGNVLATNTISYNLCVIPAEFEVSDGTLHLLSKLSGKTEKQILELVSDSRYRGFEPVAIKRGLDKKSLIEALERMHTMTGVTIEEVPIRRYPYDKLAAHVLGYIGEVSKEVLKERHELLPGDRVGKSGVEKVYDKFLQGKKGYKLVEVDAAGALVRKLSEIRARPGKTLRLTLDLRWQMACEAALKGRHGAIVVMDVNDGSILAMCSSPSFSPNSFSNGMTKSEWHKLRTDRSHPLQNKAIGGCYPPGSTFKLVTALAGLSSGVITPQTKFTCNGGLRVGRRFFRCWRRHGTVDLVRAIGQSCDTYFYRVGLLVGPERLSKYANMFLLGRNCKIDLPGERSGLVPTPSWKKARYGVRWYDGDTANYAIGQGYLLTTPLQMCIVAAAIANGGIVYRPHLLLSIEDGSGRIIKRYEPLVLSKLSINPKTLTPIRYGMQCAVYGNGGTARALVNSPISVAGKTGSSQHRRGEKPHAWFIGYAPIDSPKVAFSVIVEASGHGGEVAVPIMKQVLVEMRWWFERRERTSYIRW